MRILIFHGYLLRGTAQISRQPATALATWATGDRSARTRPGPRDGLRSHPDIGRLLPVYVADTCARGQPYADLTDADLPTHESNVAVRESLRRPAWPTT